MQIIKTNLDKSYSTHMGLLIKVVQMSQGDVVELGTGPFSTPLLHWMCKDMNRRLISYENDEEFYYFAKRFQSSLHRIVHVRDWGDDVDPRPHRGVVFVDHAPTIRRGIEAVRFKDSADYIILHDTEDSETNNYNIVWPNFKYFYTWKDCRPWVSVVSNFKDLKKIMNTL